ncbi:hypothetical protein PAEPH01_0532 [Pancytospora epiphaga]|nr:hypothetical protein PAEPH01_0532 [Pancytospora epiphaga]
MTYPRDKQAVIDLGGRFIRFCSKCNLQYNTANENDSKFHGRVHLGKKVPKTGAVSKDIYQIGNRYLYGRRRVEAWCETAWDGYVCLITDRWSSSEAALSQLMDFLLRIIPRLKI